jgi:hypothetical protein
VTEGHEAARATTHWCAGGTLADRFRAHAADATHLYEYAIRGMAQDWEAGGAIREVCRGYENAPRGALIQLRLLAGLFRHVLDRQGSRTDPVLSLSRRHRTGVGSLARDA